MEQSHDLVFVLEFPSGHLLEASPPTLDLLELPVGGLPLDAPWWKDTGVESWIPDLLLNGVSMGEWRAFTAPLAKSVPEKQVFDVLAHWLELDGKFCVIVVGRDITDRKATEDALSESRRILSGLLNGFPGMAYRCKNDPQWTMEFVSPGCRDLTGYPSKALEENRIHYSDLIYPEDRQMVWEQIQRSLREHATYRCEYRLLTAEGDVRWVWDQGSAVYDEGGDVILEGFVTDVTERKHTEEALAQSKERYQLLIESIQDGVFLIQDERMVLVNAAFAQMLGCAHEEMLGQHFIRFVAPEEREIVSSTYKRRQSGVRDVPKEYEWRMLHKDGVTRIHVNMSVTLVNFEGRVASLGTVKDITERKRIEAERRAAMERTQQQHEALMLLSAHSALAEGRLEEALEVVTQVAAKTLDVSRVSIWRILNQASTMQCVTRFDAAKGRAAPCDKILPLHRYPKYWDALQQGLVLDVANVSEDPRTSELTEERWKSQGMTSILEAPVRIHGRVVGVVNCEHAGATQRWTPGEVSFASQVADLVAQAFLNADLRRRADELAALTQVGREVFSAVGLEQMLSSIAHYAVELAEADLGVVFALGPDDGILVVGHGVQRTFVEAVREQSGWLLRDGLVGRALTQREPLQMSEIESADLHPLGVLGADEDVKSVLIVPMVSNDEVLGGILLGHRVPRHFLPEEIAFVQALAQQSISAVEKVRLLEAERVGRQRTEAIYRLARSLFTFDSEPELLQAVAYDIAEMLEIDRLSLITFNFKGDEILEFVRGGPGAHLIEFVSFEELQKGLTGWVLREGRPALSPKGQPDPRESPQVQDRRKKANCGSIVVIPLRGRDRVLGTMTAINRPDQRDFTDQDAALLSAMASHVVTAVENARLLASLAEEKARMELLYRLSRHLSESLNVDEVAQRALNEFCTELEATSGIILVSDSSLSSLRLVALWGYEKAAEEQLRTCDPDHFVRGVTGWVAEHREAVLVEDVKEDERWVHVPVLDEDAVSNLTVPLVVGSKLVGMLSLVSDRRAFFNEDHQRLAESAATTVTVAIENARLYGEAQRRARVQKWVSDIARALNSPDIKEAFPVLVEGLRELTGCHTISLILRSDPMGQGRVLVLKPPFPGLGEGYEISLSDVTAWQAVERGQSYYFESANKGCAARMSLPLFVAGSAVGLLQLEGFSVAALHDILYPVLQQIADAVAIALENARLFHSERRQRELAERLRETALLLNSSLDLQEVLELILDQLARVLPYESGTLQILDGDVMRVIAIRNLAPETLGRHYPLSQFPYNQRLAQGTGPIVIQDTKENSQGWARSDEVTHVRSNIGVPLWVRHRVIGALTVDSSYPYTYTESDARVVQAFAQQAATAIENARLFEGQRSQREFAEALEDAASAVSRTLDLDEVLDRILEQVARVMDGDTFNIMLIEDESAQVVRWRGYKDLGIEERIANLHVPVNTYPSLQKMMQDNQPVVISDTQENANWITEQEDEWRRSYVGVPIRIGGRTAGFLNMNSTQPHKFSLDHGRRLRAFAEHAAIAIQNARLYQRQMHYTEELERRVWERTAQLEAQNAWLEAILSSTSDGIIVTDSDGQIVQTNRVAFTWLNQTLSPEDAAQLRQAVRQLVRSSKRRQDVLLELTGLDLQLNAAPIFGRGGEGPATVVALHDVTYLKAVDRMKSRFVSNVSHELRTPITSIRLYASLLRRSDEERAQQYLDALDRDAERLSRLVEGILQISRIDGGRMEIKPRSTNLDDLVKTVVESHQMLAENHKVKLLYQPEEKCREDVVAFVDPDQFVQVLNNLVENSINYTPPGGEVWLSTLQEVKGERSWAKVTVKDTGIGIPQEEQAYIFDRFFRGEEPRQMQIQGSGLGLAIVKEIVELHGGRVKVTSKPGTGSTFSVWVPLANNQSK